LRSGQGGHRNSRLHSLQRTTRGRRVFAFDYRRTQLTTGAPRAAKAKAALSLSHIKYATQEVDYSGACAELRNVKDMMMSDAWQHRFVKIEPKYLSYVNNHKLFGDQVAASFVSAIPDIVDAGNCIALELGTLALFHLMRAVEYALRALCAHLGVTRIRKSKKPGKKKYVAIAWAQWEKMLDAAEVRANAKIEKLSPSKKKQDLQQFYVPIFQDIRGFKDAFRNHVMHSRDSFNVESAQAICEHVKRFMNLLATKVSE
jgi:hypothetical protein